MVFPRRLHARPSRRRQLAYTTAAFLAVMFYLFRWHPFFSERPARVDPPPAATNPDAATDSEGRGGLPLSELLSGNPPRWRDPRRDFQAEYDEVVAAVPSLRGTRPARFAFLIMAHGPSDVKLLRRNLPWLYSPLNFFLVGGKAVARAESVLSWCAKRVQRRRPSAVSSGGGRRPAKVGQMFCGRAGGGAQPSLLPCCCCCSSSRRHRPCCCCSCCCFPLVVVFGSKDVEMVACKRDNN